MQSTPGVAAPMPLVSTATVCPPQQAPPLSGTAFLQSPLATLGFTAIAPAGQALVQPIAAGEKKPVTKRKRELKCKMVADSVIKAEPVLETDCTPYNASVFISLSFLSLSFSLYQVSPPSWPQLLPPAVHHSPPQPMELPAKFSQPSTLPPASP